jgi:hypothetical protein
MVVIERTLVTYRRHDVPTGGVSLVFPRGSDVLDARLVFEITERDGVWYRGSERTRVFNLKDITNMDDLHLVLLRCLLRKEKEPVAITLEGVEGGEMVLASAVREDLHIRIFQYAEVMDTGRLPVNDVF